MHVSVAPSGPERPSVADVRPTPDPQPLLLTYAEAGTRLGVSPRTARRLAASGDLRVRRIGRRRFIAADDLAEYVASLSTRKDADASEDPAARPRHRDRAGHRRDRGRTDAA
ncbi:helix-turn-helix domain-containing protein [Pseudonocardia sp.]|uniref:helix-turn-helix domain-containing protein n=1 Tax=Pseudonocardia sp. TaxID=60912 RepID=UPI003D0CC874